MILQLSGVSKNFGGLTALNNIDFGVETGEILGVIGPNGAGKTTIFNLITGIFPVTSGELIFDGTVLGKKKTHEIIELGIARTFQNIRLFPRMSVLENVMAGAHCRSSAGLLAALFRSASQRREEQALREKALQALTLVGIEDSADLKAGSLPYGKQRRLEIARALATEPKLILLDEPAAGMNDSETEDLRHLIAEIKQMGITVVVIEHDMNLMMNLCDHLVVINFGKKIAAGTPDEVRNNPLVIEDYLGKEEDEEHAEAE